MQPLTIYKKLLKVYGHQKEWWSFKSKFEVCVGAILTQNTAWVQVEKAIKNLYAAKAMTPKKIIETDITELIACTGYKNQKSVYLKNIAEWYLKNCKSCDFVDLEDFNDLRNELLKVKGVGQETADSILLYAFDIPTFVIDTYTKRTLAELGIFDLKTPYEVLRKWFMENLEQSAPLFKEFHALFVEHGKKKFSILSI